MNFVSLSKGGIEIRFGDDDKAIRFLANEHIRIGSHIAKRQAWSFIFSSSCDFPHEYGFKRSFDVNAVLQRAVDYAREQVAIAVEPGPLAGAADRIEEQLKAAKLTLPVSLKFVKSGKKGEDVVVTFAEESAFDYFGLGLRYGARLAACTNGGACTNESASATPNGAPSAARPASTRASRRTSTTREKPTRSTAGSASHAGRSARMTKGSSPKNPRAGGG